MNEMRIAERCADAALGELYDRAGHRELWQSLRRGLRSEIRYKLIFLFRVEIANVLNPPTSQQLANRSYAHRRPSRARTLLAHVPISKELLLRPPYAFQGRRSGKCTRRAL